MYIIYNSDGFIVRNVEGYQVIGNEIQGIIGNSRFYYYKNMGFNVAEIDDIDTIIGKLYINGELIDDPDYIQPSKLNISEINESDINNLSEEDATMLWGMLSERLLNK